MSSRGPLLRLVRRLRVDVAMMTGCCFLAVGHCASALFSDEGGHLLFVLAWPVVAVALIPVVALHELGHVAGAWWAGYRVHAVRVRPFLVTVQPFRVRLVWRLPARTAGWVLSSPTTIEAGGRRGDYALVVAGGPVASLAGGGLLALPQSTDAGVVLASLGLLSIGVGIGNLVSPRRTSDGVRLRRLARRRRAAPTGASAALLWYVGVDRRRWTAWDEAGLRRRRSRRLSLTIDFVDALAAGRTADAATILEELRDAGETARWLDYADAHLRCLAGEEAPARALAVRGILGDDPGVREVMFATLKLRDGDRGGARRLLRPLLRGRAPFLNPVWRRLARRVLSAAPAHPLSNANALA